MLREMYTVARFSVIFYVSLAVAAEAPIGFRTLRNEVVDAPTVVTGNIPSWLKGYSIRQQCGSLGDIENLVDGSYTESFFDCIPAMSQFKIDGDRSSFYNRYPDTITTKIWKQFNMNMTASGIYFPTAFSSFDPEKLALYPDQRRFPAATFWKIGEEIIAHGESTYADLVDLTTLKTRRYEFNDHKMGYPDGISFFLHNPAHEHIDGDFSWSTTSVAIINPKTFQLTLKQAVYKIQNGVRTVFSEYQYGVANLAKCQGGAFPDLSMRPGYMHAFLMTEHYLIFPITSYLIDPCALFVYKNALPLFMKAYEFYPEEDSKVLIMRKCDGTWVKDVRTEAFFATHMLNAYENGNEIVADFLTFPNAEVYQKRAFVDSLIQEIPWDSRVERFRFCAETFELKRREPITDYMMLEFSNINYDRYNGKKYRYAYIANRPSFSKGTVIKLDLVTRKMKHYVPPEGHILQEPNFVENPDGRCEDDGVVVVQGLNSITGESFLSILDAQTMEEIARITSPEYMLFGIHSKYFTLADGERSPRIAKRSAQLDKEYDEIQYN